MNDVSAMHRVRIKDVLVEVGPRSKTGKGLPLSMTQDRGLIPTSEANVANPPSTYIGAKKVIPGDLVFNKLKAHLGVFAVSDYSGLVSPDYAVYRLRRDSVDIRYLNYLFHTPEYIDEFILRRSGVADGLKRLYTRELFQVSIPLPPKSLQSSIVNFLDAKCAEIDKAIEAAEASIEEYKLYKKSVIFQAVTKGLDPDAPMKDSGIEWIGKIPSSWDVVPQKILMRKTKSICEKWAGEDVLSLTVDGVIVRDLANPKGKMPTTFDGYQFVSEGNLLLCLFDIDVTPRCVGVIRNDGVTSPAYSQFELIGGDSVDFYYWYLRAMDDQKLYLHLTNTLRSSFTADDFGKIVACRPPLSEQVEISEHLAKKCSEIDGAIKAKRQIIDELKAYKKSLIWEFVTGKREV